MKYLLGLDGGGTKTDMLLCMTDGTVVIRCIGGPSSLTGQTEQEVYENIRYTLNQALVDFKTEKDTIVGFYAGISGAGLKTNQDKYREMFSELLPNAEKTDVGSDAVNALSSGTGQGDGIIAIAGTGSSVFARIDGVMHQVGGWGYLLGDEGSGFDLGRRAILSALRMMDHRGLKTSLYDACIEKSGCSMRDFVAKTYTGESKKVIASYATVLLEEAEKGDAVALQQLKLSCADMAEAIVCAGKDCKRKLVVMGGSIWKNELYRKMVKESLPGEYDFIAPDLPPVYGSVVQAAALAGVKTDKQFENNIRKSWKCNTYGN